MKTEQRKNNRRTIDLPVFLRCRGRFLAADLINLSTTGLCLKTSDVDIAIDAPVEVTLDLSDYFKDVALTGRVVWVKSEEESLLGIAFTQRSSVNHQTLERFLQQMS